MPADWLMLPVAMMVSLVVAVILAAKLISAPVLPALLK